MCQQPFIYLLKSRDYKDQTHNFHLVGFACRDIQVTEHLVNLYFIGVYNADIYYTYILPVLAPTLIPTKQLYITLDHYT